MRALDPVRRPGSFVVVSVDPAGPVPAEAEASVREEEGRTLVLAREAADRRGLAYDHVAAWITLTVTTTLDEVGVTAAFSARLAEAGISCNVLAGLHHDHLLVAEDRADEALALLRGTG